MVTSDYFEDNPVGEGALDYPVVVTLIGKACGDALEALEGSVPRNEQVDVSDPGIVGGKPFGGKQQLLVTQWRGGEC